MEVFVRGVPERTTGHQLSTLFQPILSKMAIENWQCHKMRRKNYATLTFLNPVDGQRFLNLYGQAKKGLRGHYLPAGRTNLIFQGMILLCSQSNKPPNPWAVKSLEMAAKDRQKTTKQPAKVNNAYNASDKGPTVFECGSISCGLWEYIDSKLVFTSHSNWLECGTMKFGAKAAVVKMDTGQSIDIPYSTIQAIATQGLPRPAMTLTLTEAPHFFQSVDEARTSLTGDVSDLFGALLRFSPQNSRSKERMPGLNSEHEKNAGSCLVYRVALANEPLDEHMNALSRAHGIPPTTRCYVDTHRPQERYETEIGRLAQAFSTSYSGLPFSVKFQVQKLAQNGYLSPNKVLALLPEIASMCSRSNVRLCVKAIRRLFQQLSFPGPDTDAMEFQLEAIISLLRGNEERLKIGGLYLDEPIGSNQLAIIHRVSITPAGTYLYGPDPENNNRVLRKYPGHHDYFVRVQFSDEDGMQVQYHPDISNDLIFYNRFKQVLEEGISIGGRQFAFLGFSHSSLRAQSCWFMAPFLHNGRLLFDRMVVEGLGNFSRIRCPAKCAARIGQAFSETPTAVTLAPGVAKEMKDVERNGRVFSDGVGTVSLAVLKQMWSALPHSKRTKPSLFQIRYSGIQHHVRIVPLAFPVQDFTRSQSTVELGQLWIYFSSSIT
jgi:RNA dependent RNA polymerase